MRAQDRRHDRARHLGRRSARENAVRYDLVWERGGWAIDDVHSVVEPNAWSLRALLKRYLAE